VYGRGRAVHPVQRFRNQVFHAAKASDFIAVFPFDREDSPTSAIRGAFQQKPGNFIV
jgi:hypothetical protein